ncbi:MAG: MlaE family lipid ABC transporter permease subunit [Candidatus Eisenbacteria bacterium]
MNEAMILESAGGKPEFHCSGRWTVSGIGRLEAGADRISWPADGEVVLVGSGIEAMDTAGAWLLRREIGRLERGGGAVRLLGFRDEHQSLLDLVARWGNLRPPPEDRPFRPFHDLGAAASTLALRTVRFLSFTGQVAVAWHRTIIRPWRGNWRELFLVIQTAGLHALPIVGLLIFLLGVVISYQSVLQLKRYGADIFVVDLIGLSVLRELAPLLTAIIVAGRTGSAFTAEIGTMKITEELDALRTLGIDPMDSIVVPRLGALWVVLPLLTVYADAVGVLGGLVMTVILTDITPTAFLARFPEVVTTESYLIGVGKATLFAALIATVGCYQGFRVEGSADSIGRQTTVSVVQAIFLIILTDALFSVVFSWLGI